MKNIIAFLLLVIVAECFAKSHKVKRINNEDDIKTYSGKCILHEDYENINFEVNEIIPYIQYPTKEYFNNLNSLQKNLVLFVYEEENEEQGDLNNLEGFDDITFDTIQLKNENSPLLHRVTYGVGGGNGGYMTFLVLSIDNFILLARTFDADIVYCHSDFKK